jgi:sulfite exporter TauE/SafE
MTEFSLLSAFVIGLLGAAHCIGMCGGVIASLSSAIPNYKHADFKQKLPFLVNYNVGRVFSYAIAGFIVASSSEMLTKSFALNINYLHIFSSLVLFLMGLYIANISNLLARIEKIGSILWKRLSPMTKVFLPLQSPLQAVPLGMLWGWLPCGLVYSMLTWSLAAGDGTQGALIMLCFGLGTAPVLFLVGSAATHYKNMVQNQTVRLILGIAIMLYAQWLFVMALINLLG